MAESENIRVDAKLVPKHYTVSATVDADGMFELISTLRRFCDEFEAPPAAVVLLAALENAYVGELPQRIDIELLPHAEPDDDDGEEALA